MLGGHELGFSKTDTDARVHMHAINEAFAPLLKSCLRYGVGEHDMVECKICDGIGHNDILGDEYGIKHTLNCAYAAAAK